MKRNAMAIWKGSGKNENGVGANPEELLAAAHAAC